MKVRIAKDLYDDIKARADLLGCDVSEVARRALRMADRSGARRSSSATRRRWWCENRRGER